ncbi:ligand-dependent nuclear receptor-interacting factor 1 isoform X1 [Gopherus evgoodei]|uniref:Ligand dependent nuclear receptor interacting factor 1 n=1 Tax=Gopherus evgoodei TaxID=1825980 RepID=A0A8C4YEF7_9SAUR|nr:ligand-dependent nuclear receptor-interacting factor 1 isoform X1 [Gopherus evgoodei]
MSGPPLGAPHSPEEGPGSAAQCIAGCMYQVVQTTGPDGKNLLKLLPISKSSGNFMPLVQSSVVPDTAKGNVSSPVHFTFKTQIASSTTSSSVKIPVFKSTNPGKIILTRTLDKQENLSVNPEKESLTTKPVSNVQSNSVSVDRLSLQNVAVSTSSNQSNTAYVLVNTKSLPVTVKSPVLPSGHHLQIPAHAEVKSVPASSLPPTVQQKILAAAATNASGAAEATKTPTVIYVSPVNTVKTVVPKRLQTICPKPVTEVSESLILTTAQTTVKSSVPPVGTSDGQQRQQTPMKWVVQENSQASIPYLIPVKSSNNMASKILKTLADMKNVEKNSANILPICSNSPSGSQTITPIKDNALVMYNGKVYLLTKRGSDVLSAQIDQQASPGTDAPFKKDTSQLITNKVVNLVLSKNKGMTLTQKDPKPSINTELVPQPDLRKNLKPAPALLATPHVNQHIITTNQCRPLSTTGGISNEVNPVKKMVMDENMHCNSKEKSHSPKAATAVTPQSKQHYAFSEEEQKIQNEKVCSSKKATEIKHKREPHWKQYLELRKKFGLFKEERVYLNRIPFRTPPAGSEASVCSRNNFKKNNDSWSASPQEMAITAKQQDHGEEEKIIVDLEQDLTKKRKAKLSPVPENGKRRKMMVKSAINPSVENNSTSSVILNKRISSTPVLLQQKNSTSSIGSSLGKNSEQDPCVQDNQVQDTCCSALVSSKDDVSTSESSFRDDAFPLTPPDLDETIRDEKIKRLKRLLRERAAALEEMRKKMQQT